MKKNVLILAAALALVACGGNAPKKKAAAETQTTTAAVPTCTLPKRRSTTWAPTKAPCRRQTAPGIQTTLTLNPDGAYKLHMKYIDRDTELDEWGRFTIEANQLTLYPDEGEPTGSYRVEENRLRMLDAENNPSRGALAENYVLQKTK